MSTNKGKIIFQIPSVETILTSSKLMLECEWYITMSDGSALDSTTAPVDLWTYWSFKNVKLQLGSTGLQTIEVMPMKLACISTDVFFKGLRTIVWSKKLHNADGST